MTIEEIKELIKVVNDSGIAELEVARGDNRVRIRRSMMPPPAQEIVLPAPANPLLAPMNPAPQASLPVAIPPSAPIPDETTVYIKSPIVGTYYEAPSPASPAFVRIGDKVTTGQVLCIIESMKLMNEIESEVTGTILSKLVENGKPVEYGEALFAIQPA